MMKAVDNDTDIDQKLYQSAGSDFLYLSPATRPEKLIYLHFTCYKHLYGKFYSFMHSEMVDRWWSLNRLKYHLL